MKGMVVAGDTGSRHLWQTTATADVVAMRRVSLLTLCTNLACEGQVTKCGLGGVYGGNLGVDGTARRTGDESQGNRALEHALHRCHDMVDPWLWPIAMSLGRG